MRKTGNAISHDLTTKQRKYRKFWKNYPDQQRNLCKKSELSRNKLIVNNVEFTIGDLRKLEDVKEVQRANSVPATPTQVLIKEVELGPDIDNREKNYSPNFTKNTTRNNLR